MLFSELNCCPFNRVDFSSCCSIIDGIIVTTLLFEENNSVIFFNIIFTVLGITIFPAMSGNYYAD